MKLLLSILERFAVWAALGVAGAVSYVLVIAGMAVAAVLLAAVFVLVLLVAVPVVLFGGARG